MKVTYIGHSSFALEWEHCFWIFDYEKGPLPDISPQKAGFVFVSHKHADHYNPAIFQWKEIYPQLTYILDDGIFLGPRQREAYHLSSLHPSRLCQVRPHQDYIFPDGAGQELHLRTLKSTDCGVAFLLTYQGRTIYHAGDLNLWVWAGESKQYNNNMTANFFKEIEYLKGRRLDLAFLPLDPRQEEDAFLGMDALFQAADIGLAFPMHFWNEPAIISRMKEQPCSSEYRHRIIHVQNPGQSWEIPL